MSDIFSPGFLSGRAIQDVFTEKMSQLQHEILPLGTPNRRQIIEFVDGIRVRLLGRCEALPQPKAKAKPQPKALEKTADGELPPPDSRADYDAYVARHRR